jgi:7-cyano-7-deazaguanine synthase
MKAVVLLSGGLDSTTAMAIAKSQGYDLYALSFDYGQRHHFELEAARRICAHIQVRRHLIFPLDLTAIGGSALTADIDVPKDRANDQIEHAIPVTYVPARNTIFLSVALAWAEVIKTADIFIGVNAVDYSGYPDCRPQYITAFQNMANLGTQSGVEGRLSFRIHTPLIDMTKSQIIQTGLKLGVDYGLTHSCYDPFPDGSACGRCDSCVLRRKGFLDAGVADPTKYGQLHRHQP